MANNYTLKFLPIEDGENYISTTEYKNSSYVDSVLGKNLPTYQATAFFGYGKGEKKFNISFPSYNITTGSETSDGNITTGSPTLTSLIENGYTVEAGFYDNRRNLAEFGIKKHYPLKKYPDYIKFTDLISSNEDYTDSTTAKYIYTRNGNSYDLVTGLTCKSKTFTYETYFLYINGKKYAHVDIYFPITVNSNAIFGSGENPVITFKLKKIDDSKIMPDDTPSGGTTKAEIISNLTHATINIDTSKEYSKDENILIIVTPDDGYYFSNIPTFNNKNFSEFENGKYYYNATLEEVNNIRASATEKISVTFNKNFNNCTSDIDDSKNYYVGDTINITLTADDGYVFSGFPSISDYGVFYNFNLTADYKTAYITHKITSQTVNIYGNCILSSKITTNFYAIYAPSDVYIKNFASNHVYSVDGGGVTEYDISPYMYNIYKLPFNLEKFISLKQVSGIEFYKYSYNVPVNYVTDEYHIFEINFGTVEINRHFYNKYDYEGDVFVQIPFFNTLKINISDVLGHELTCKGKINLYDRTMVFSITDENDFEIVENKSQIGYNFPIVNNIFKSTGNYSDEIQNNLDRVKIILNYNFSIVNCSDLIGVVYADDVDLVGFSGTEEEREELITILENGVNYGTE